MGILDRFFGNDQQLTRPDFNRFKHIELDFSGTKIKFKDAAHTAMFPINDWPHDMDIYKPTSYEPSDNRRYAKRFYLRGWEFTGKSRRAHGGCRLSSQVYYHPDQTKDNAGYFKKEILEQQIYRYCHNMWGDQNKGSSLGNLGEAYYTYPIKSSDVSYQNINGTNWCRFSAERKGKPPEILYATPISKHHIIVNAFTLSAFGGTDFYSPETNLEQTCYDVVNDFMSEYFIELSPRAKAERAAVSDPV